MSAPEAFPGTQGNVNILDNDGIISSAKSLAEKQILVMENDSSSSTVRQVYSRVDDSTITEGIRESATNIGGLGMSLEVDLYNEDKNTMGNALSLSPVACSIKCFDETNSNITNEATLSVDGLRWSNADSALYLGGDKFRIRVSQDNNLTDTLTIESLATDETTYVTKFQISR